MYSEEEVTPQIQKILDEIEKDPNYSIESCFMYGLKFREIQFDLFTELIKCNSGYLNSLILKLLIASKISTTDIVLQYTKTLERKIEDNKTLTADLASSLILYRKNIFDENKDAKRADESLEKTGLFNY